MSICSTKETIKRIKNSDFDRPLAVFMSNQKHEFNVVPANTVITQQKINNKDKDFLGVFHCRMSKKEIQSFLHPEENEVKFM